MVEKQELIVFLSHIEKRVRTARNGDNEADSLRKIEKEIQDFKRKVWHGKYK